MLFHQKCDGQQHSVCEKLFFACELPTGRDADAVRLAAISRQTGEEVEE